MLKGHTIRSNPGVCNQENRPRHIKRADIESFGVYRPVDIESMQKLHDTLIVVREDVNDFLSKRRKTSSDIQIQESLGVTYLQQQRVRRAIRKGTIAGGFALTVMTEGVDEINRQTGDEVSVELDLDRFEWYSQHRRKMVACFSRNAVTDQMATEAETIGDILEEASTKPLRVVPPDHVTLFKYGREGDRLDLSSMHQREVSTIVREHFEDSPVGELQLGRLVVGKTYTEPVVESFASMAA